MLDLLNFGLMFFQSMAVMLGSKTSNKTFYLMLLSIFYIWNNHAVNASHLRGHSRVTSISNDIQTGSMFHRLRNDLNSNNFRLQGSNRETVNKVTKSPGRRKGEGQNQFDQCLNVTYLPPHSKQKKMYPTSNEPPFACCGCNWNERLEKDCNPGEPATRVCVSCSPDEFLHKYAHNMRVCDKLSIIQTISASPPENIVLPNVTILDENLGSILPAPNTTSLSFGPGPIFSTTIQQQISTSVEKNKEIQNTSPDFVGVIVGVLITVVTLLLLIIACVCLRKKKKTCRGHPIDNNSSGGKNSIRNDNRLESTEVVIAEHPDSPEDHDDLFEQEDDTDSDVLTSSETLLNGRPSKGRTRTLSERLSDGLDKLGARCSSFTTNSSLKRNSVGEAKKVENQDVAKPLLPRQEDLEIIDETMQQSASEKGNHSVILPIFTKHCGTKQSSFSDQPSSSIAASSNSNPGNAASSSREERTSKTKPKSSPGNSSSNHNRTNNAPKCKVGQCVLPLPLTFTSSCGSSSSQSKMLADSWPTKPIPTEEEKITCIIEYLKKAPGLEIFPEDNLKFGRKFNISPPQYPHKATGETKLAMQTEKGFKEGKYQTAKEIMDFLKENNLNFAFQRLLDIFYSKGYLNL